MKQRSAAPMTRTASYEANGEEFAFLVQDVLRPDQLYGPPAEYEHAPRPGARPNKLRLIGVDGPRAFYRKVIEA